VISAVLDSNTLVSAILVPHGIPAQVLAEARNGRFTIITSSAIATEVFRVLHYPRIQRRYQIGPVDVARLRRLLQRRAIITPLTHQVIGVASHPEDDLILATAVSGSADYLVTGDAALQRLETYEIVKIVSPRQFLITLRANPSEGTPADLA
jgi:uncharacterized protein